MGARIARTAVWSIEKVACLLTCVHYKLTKYSCAIVVRKYATYLYGLYNTVQHCVLKQKKKKEKREHFSFASVHF